MDETAGKFAGEELRGKFYRRTRTARTGRSTQMRSRRAANAILKLKDFAPQSLAACYLRWRVELYPEERTRSAAIRAMIEQPRLQSSFRQNPRR